MAAMDDQAKQAFTAATDWSKQILTLSTAVLTLTVTFADKIFGGNLSNSATGFLFLAWFFYLLSIGGGIVVLTKLTGILASDTAVGARDVRQSANEAAVQVWTFVAGTVAIGIFGLIAV